MKNVLLALSIAFFLLNGSTASAQILTENSKDTAIGNYTGGSLLSVYNRIKSGSGNNLRLKWNISSYSFGPGWDIATSGFCDNILCRSSIDSVNNLFVDKTVYYSDLYNNSGFTGTSHDFHMQFGTPVALPDGSSSWVRVSVMDTFSKTSRTLTFIGYKFPAGVGSINSSDDVVLYPNPAGKSVNVIYDENAGVRTIAVYNMIGKVMGPIYKPSSTNSAKINLDDMPAGIYFLRLMNSQGHVVATRRFTHQ